MGIFDRFFGGSRRGVARNYMGGNASGMLPRYTTPPERNTREWFRMKIPGWLSWTVLRLTCPPVPESCSELTPGQGRKPKSWSIRFWILWPTPTRFTK